MSKTLEIKGVLVRLWCWKCNAVTEHEISRRFLATGPFEIVRCIECKEVQVETWNGSNEDSRIPPEVFMTDEPWRNG